MIGIFVQLAISWLLLYIFYKKDIRALGALPSKMRLIDLVFGLALGGLSAAAYTGLVSVLTETRWHANPGFTLVQAFDSAAWMLRSVLFEELIFRGALLYIALRLLSSTQACLLSAVAFGIYHWFSYGVLGNPLMMAFVFITTGAAGFAWAIAFARTASMYLPIALHFGVNLVNSVVFSQGSLGPQWLMYSVEESQRLGIVGSILTNLFNLAFLLGSTLLYLLYRPKPESLDWAITQRTNAL